MKRITRSYSNNKGYVGYCNHYPHRGYITIGAADEHNCFDKKCPYFKPNYDHPIYTVKAFQTKQIKRKHYLKMRTQAQELYKKYIAKNKEKRK